MDTSRSTSVAARLTAVAATAALAACQVTVPDNEVEQAPAENIAIPAVPTADPPMNRAELLSAIAAASSMEASGGDDSEAQRKLDGRRFEIRIRFGCRGPADDLPKAVLGWSFDPEERTLRVRATPTISADSPVASRVAGEDVEAVEGFWVPRPWLLEPGCPVAAMPAPSVAEGTADTGSEKRAKTSAGPRAGANASMATNAAQRPAAGSQPGEDLQETRSPPQAYPKIGIAQFFTANDPRTRQRSMRPYEITKILPPDTPPAAKGYNLVLAGRLSALSSGGVIHCVSRGVDAPPDCIASVSIDRVWIERPDGGERLAEWSSS